MTRTDLFGPVPVIPRRWRMHATDAGNFPDGRPAAHFRCKRCNYDSGWIHATPADARAGVPCPPCNTALPDGVPANWPFGDLSPARYCAILADPPWRFLNRSAKGEKKNPVAHYPCMTIDQLAQLPVARLAAPDCALVTWATAPLLDRSIELVKTWGFTFKSAGAWAKQSSTGQRWAFGPGYVYRSAVEFFIVATIGKPRVRSHSVRNLIVAPTREHSRKPDAMHADVEALYAGPYAELFARQRRPGWDAWGNEVEKFGDDQ